MLKGEKMKCKCKGNVYEDLKTHKELLRQANHKIPKWVSIEEALPAIKQDVIAYIRGERNSFSAINIITCTFTKYGFERARVTHWMPLPKPPTGG